ncbi:uncharacterized protein LOC119185638 isoform X2 [Rhipicephalus microplus]|uniref:uncharacterized protein LOC119185638 isoform X2 n=1 Tax=Rhipicephalus microplus TaxID=6941 RepID=UPI003F6D3A4A
MFSSEFHSRHFVGHHHRGRSLRRASTMASNSLYKLLCHLGHKLLRGRGQGPGHLPVNEQIKRGKRLIVCVVPRLVCHAGPSGFGLQTWSSVILTSEILPGSRMCVALGTGDVMTSTADDSCTLLLALTASYWRTSVLRPAVTHARYLHEVVERFGVQEQWLRRLDDSPADVPNQTRAHVVLVPVLLVPIVGFLGSLRRNPRQLAIYVVAVTPFVLLPFANPALCIGPQTTIKHLCPQYVSSFLDVVLVGNMTSLWMWTSWSGAVLVMSIISTSRLFEATSGPSPCRASWRRPVDPGMRTARTAPGADHSTMPGRCICEGRPRHKDGSYKAGAGVILLVFFSHAIQCLFLFFVSLSTELMLLMNSTEYCKGAEGL